MLTCLLLLYILLPYHLTRATSVLLLPTTDSNNGASITVLKDTTIVSNTKWLISPTDNTGFHMKLSLDNTWSFHPIYPTSIKIQLNSDSPTDDPNRALLISFSQSNNTYISTMIQLDQSNDHLIYPHCQIYPNKSSLLTGDIYSILQNTVPNITTLTRIQRAMNNTLDSYYLPYTNPPNLSYPLTFILENNPANNNLLFSYTNPTAPIRTCSYNNMTANISMQIYLAVTNSLQNMSILSINITHYINEAIFTFTPTKNPTMEPTLNPTIEPSMFPTDYPTMAPVKSLFVGGGNTTAVMDQTTTEMFTSEILKVNDDKQNIFGLNIAGDILFLIFCVVGGVCLCLCCIFIVTCMKKISKQQKDKGMIVQALNVRQHIHSISSVHDTDATNIEVVELNGIHVAPKEKNPVDSDHDHDPPVQAQERHAKVTVTVLDDDCEENVNGESSEDSSDEAEEKVDDKDDDPDHSLYKLQHQFLSDEINQMEDEHEHERLLLLDINIMDNGHAVTDDGSFLVETNGTVEHKQNEENEEFESEENDENEKDLLVGMTTTGGNDDEMNEESEESEESEENEDLLVGMITTGGNDDETDDDENVPPPPLPPVSTSDDYQ